jgi:hypothetical protein
MAQVALLKTIQEGISALDRNPAEALRKAREITQAYVTNADPKIKSVAIALDKAITKMQAKQRTEPIQIELTTLPKGVTRLPKGGRRTRRKHRPSV